MTYPKRWLEDDDTASALRDVLRAGREMDPPKGAEKAVWLSLAAQVGAAGAAAGAATAAAKAAAKASAEAAAGTGAGAAAGAASGGLVKAILVGAFSGIVAVSGYSALEPVLSPPAPAPPATEPASPPQAPVQQKAPARRGDAAQSPSVQPSSAPSSAPAPAGDAREPAPSVAASSAASPPAVPPSDEAPAASPGSDVGAAAPLPGSPEERASRLREENELLSQARGALRGGDPGRAMLLLEQARQKFPGGVLGQEREALTIEALAKGGAREAASARAAAFIKAHPTSPHAARLQAFILP